MSTKIKLDHSRDCKPDRLELTAHPEQGITAHHCLDCGAHAAITDKGAQLPTPAVTGGMVDLGRGDMDVTMRRATPADVSKVGG